MTKRTLICIAVGFTRRKSFIDRKGGKGGRRVAVYKRYYTYTLTEGKGKPQFTFDTSTPGKYAVGDRFRAVTSEWCKHDCWAYPTYERIGEIIHGKTSLLTLF